MQHQKEVENVIGEWNLLGALMNDEVTSLSWCGRKVTLFTREQFSIHSYISFVTVIDMNVNSIIHRCFFITICFELF